MKVLLFGATGMIGSGVLRECTLDVDVTEIVCVGRSAVASASPKVRSVVHRHLFDLGAVSGQLAGFDACFFCVGVTSAGMSETDYRRMTYDLTYGIAQLLQPLNPAMTFVYVSGTGADSTEKGAVMWARVRGALENALLKLPFKGVYVVRPAFVRPLHGITSRTPLYQFFYTWLGWIFPILNVLRPSIVTTTERLGKAMLVLAKRGASKRVLETSDFNALVP
jgi:uncharacterized protein YbjT (DUF2867 family)